MQRWIAKKLTKEPELPDRQIGEAVYGDRHNPIDDVILVPGLEHALHFAPVVLPCVESAAVRCLNQQFVRAAVGQRIGDGVTGIARREHLAPVHIRLSLAEFKAIDNIRPQNHRLAELINGLLGPQFLDVRLRQCTVFGFLLA